MIPQAFMGKYMCMMDVGWLRVFKLNEMESIEKYGLGLLRIFVMFWSHKNHTKSD
jgi:hypothetical protein